MIPLNLRLKRKAHKELAYAQDIVVEELYKFFPRAVIHGGTVIWRCYKGNRFSEDIDIYIKRDEERIREFFRHLESKGFKIIKKRIKENSLYSELSFNGALVRVEAVFKNIKKIVLKEYETSESFFMNIYTLSPEDLIMEKAETYLKRKKIRDLYDVFFLLRYVKEKGVIDSLKNLVKNYSKPIDEGNLKSIIISGLIPSSEEMLRYIERWVR